MSLCVYVRELPVRGTPPALPLATAGSLTLGLRTSSGELKRLGLQHLRNRRYCLEIWLCATIFARRCI